MFIFTQYLNLCTSQFTAYQGPESGPSVESQERVNSTPETTATPESPEVLGAEVESAADQATQEQSELSEATEALDPETAGEGTREQLNEGGDQNPNESEDQLSPEIREELMDDMTEEERADFESKTPEEQQEYLLRQVTERDHQELLSAMRELGIEGLDNNDLQSVFGDMTPDEIAEFESLPLEEQTRVMQEHFDARVAAADAIIAQERARLEAESRTATPQRQAEIRREVEGLGRMGAAVRGQGPGSYERGFFRGEVGQMTPEQLAEFGITGQRLAEYAATCTPATDELYYCGKNTGEALNGFYREIGKPELQINDRPRHGFMWSQLLASRPDDYREIQVPASEAPPGAIISYAAGPGGSSAFAQYGHVEISLGTGQYYFGQIASSPGGSRRPPVEGEYRVFMPIALGNSDGQPFPHDS